MGAGVLSLASRALVAERRINKNPSAASASARVPMMTTKVVFRARAPSCATAELALRLPLATMVAASSFSPASLAAAVDRSAS
jgi:hypothetical protein